MLNPRRYHAIIITAAIVAGCGQPAKQTATVPSTTNAPTIVLDEAHNQASGAKSSEYFIPPGETLVVDSGSYTIRVPEKLKASGPNALHLVHGSEEYYRVPWNGSGQVQVNPATLEVVKGPTKFIGFKAGEKYLIAIGVDRFSESDKQLAFSVMWVGEISVK